jgi:Skp family chaperone for outer membrane proteins
MKRSWWMGLLAGIAVGAVVFTAGSGLYAQDRGSFGAGRVACLDVIKIFNEYERQKELTEEMRAVEQEMQNEIERRRGQIDTLQATLDAMSDSDPAKFKRQREMFQLQLDYKNWAELMQADMAREVGLWTRKIYNEVRAAAEEIALRDGYDMVFYREGPELVGYDPEAVRDQIRSRKLIYASPTVNVTQAVLDKLNADYRAQPKQQMLQISPTLGP